MDFQHRTNLNSHVQATASNLSAPFLKLPAWTLPAVLLVGFVFVTNQTVRGQAPSEAQAIEVSQLIQQLDQIEYEPREAAERRLIEIGSPAVDSLVSALLDCSPDACSRIKRILLGVAKQCDEEALFKVLATLRVRYEIPTERIKPLLDQWAIESRAAIVARWRQQGAIVVDPFQDEFDANANVLEELFQRQRGLDRGMQRGFRFEIKGDDIIGLSTDSAASEVDQGEDLETMGSMNERLKLVLGGALEQNKKIVLDSKKGADGFEKSINLLQEQPVAITIGENWRGNFSDFDLVEAQAILPINSLEVQKKVIDDALLSVLNKHPLSAVSLVECSIAADVTQTFPNSVVLLTIDGSNDPKSMLQVITKEDPGLTQVRFLKGKFDKAQALALKDLPRLAIVELMKIDLDKSAFEGLASVRQLRRLKLEQCKFPAAAFIDYRDKRRGDVIVDFTAKAFLGVSSARDFRQNGRFQPKQAETDVCTVASIVPGEAAQRAGMEAGDQIVSVAGQKIKSFDELRIAIAQCEIGEEVAIQIRRDGKEMELKAVMGEPAEPAIRLR